MQEEVNKDEGDKHNGNAEDESAEVEYEEGEEDKHKRKAEDGDDKQAVIPKRRRLGLSRKVTPTNSKFPIPKFKSPLLVNPATSAPPSNPSNSTSFTSSPNSKTSLLSTKFKSPVLVKPSSILPSSLHPTSTDPQENTNISLVAPSTFDSSLPSSAPTETAQTYFYNVMFAIASKKKKNYLEGTLTISAKKKCKLQNMKGKIIMEDPPFAEGEDLNLGDYSIEIVNEMDKDEVDREAKSRQRPKRGDTELKTKPIESSSIGWRLLTKMGWEGGSIGKTQNGLKAPLEITVKNSNYGLGYRPPIGSEFLE